MSKKALLIFTLLCSPVAAQSLYGALPPPDATFVRAVDIGGGATSVALGDKTVALQAGAITNYVVLTAGTNALGTTSLEMEPQKYYTLLVGADGANVVLEDKAEVDKAKVTIEFFNLTDAPVLDLAVATGSPLILEGVPQNQSDVRKVNPRAVAFGAVSGGAVAATSEEIDLVRGKVYTVLALGPSDGMRLVVVENMLAAE